MSEVTGQSTTVEWRLGPGEVPMALLQAALSEDHFELLKDGFSQRSSGDLDAASIQIMGILAESGIAVREIRRGVSLEQRFIEGTKAS